MYRLCSIVVVFSLLISAGWAQSKNPFAPSENRKDDPVKDPFGDPFSSKPRPERDKKEPATETNKNSEVERFLKMQKDFDESTQKKAAELAKLPDDQKLEWLHREYNRQLVERSRGLERLVAMAARSDQQNRQMDDERSRLQQEIQRLRDENSELAEQTTSMQKKVAQLMDQGKILEEISIQTLKHGNPETKNNTLHSFLDAINAAQPHAARLGFGRELVDAVFSNTLSEIEETKFLAIRLAIHLDPDRALKNGYQGSQLFWHPLESATSYNRRPNIRRELAEVWPFSITIYAETLHELAESLSWGLDDATVVVKPGIAGKIEIVDMEFEDVTISTMLTILGEKVGFRHVIRDNVIELHATDSDALRVTLNYRVDGLLTKDRKIEKLIELIDAMQPEGEKIKVVKVSANQIAVIGDEAQQKKVGELLGKLPRIY